MLTDYIYQGKLPDYIEKWRKTNYSHQKQYWQHEEEQNDNQKTKMEEKQVFKRLTSNIYLWKKKKKTKKQHGRG